jgi:hypothetical protein
MGGALEEIKFSVEVKVVSSYCESQLRIEIEGRVAVGWNDV